MANRWRGEVTLEIDGQPQVARLTLGALAELEDALAEPSLVSLVERFEAGQFSARDVILLLVAALNAGGAQFDVASLSAADIGGGPVGAARVAAKLLARAFVVAE